MIVNKRPKRPPVAVRADHPLAHRSSQAPGGSDGKDDRAEVEPVGLEPDRRRLDALEKLAALDQALGQG